MMAATQQSSCGRHRIGCQAFFIDKRQNNNNEYEIIHNDFEWIFHKYMAFPSSSPIASLIATGSSLEMASTYIYIINTYNPCIIHRFPLRIYIHIHIISIIEFHALNIKYTLLEQHQPTQRN